MLTITCKYYHIVDEAETCFIEKGLVNIRQTHRNIYEIGILGDYKE